MIIPSLPRLVLPILLLAAPATGEVVRLDAAAETRAGIVTRPVLEGAFGDQIRVVGRVVRAPGSTVTVKALVEGRIDELHVLPGEDVEADAPLVTLHCHELHELKSRYLRTRQAKALADSRVRAGEQLFELDGISRLELEERRQRALAARLEVESVLAEMEHLGYARQEAERMDDPDWHPVLTVRSPIAGAVLELAVEEHGWVDHYEPMVVIGDPDRLELELQLTPDDSDRVAPGDVVEFVPVGRPEQPGRAEVITGVPRVDPTTRTVTVRARITEGRGRTLPGVFVEGTLTRGEAAPRPSLPEAAVIRVGAEDHVFVKAGPGAYEARPVRTGRFDGSRYEILAGVETGEEVAVE
ncbi:MAG: efflux RND transporter periplasmic adaptor subunit, partial [Holophagales bacterium]|nr:efflux RND transporter periplasmic adaptor subunit [Holophagales bacterium]